MIYLIPSLFIGHGAPTIIYDNNEYTDFLKSYSKTISKPKAIVIFSAHYESNIQLIGTSTPYEMIYDFYGFPKDLYSIKYQVSSNDSLAMRVKTLLKESNIESKLDPNRGIDHGAWTVLKLMYPNCDIPVITMSVNTMLSNQGQYNIGKALECLRNEDVLIICSGGIVHNLSKVSFDSEDVDPWANKFNEWIKDKISKWDLNQVLDYENNAPFAKLAVPRNEHFLELLIAMGTEQSNKKPALLKSMYQYGNLSLDFWQFN